MREITGFILLVSWIAGFVIVKGFWSTAFCIIPFWSWYLVVDKLLVFYKLI